MNKTARARLKRLEHGERRSDDVARILWQGELMNIPLVEGSQEHREALANPAKYLLDWRFVIPAAPEGDNA